MKTLIAVDIDEVLSPFVSGLVIWHNLHFGTNYSVQDFISYNFHQIWGGSIEEAIDKSCRYFENRAPETCQPLADAKRVLNRLSQDYELIVVTSRTLKHASHTEAWLNEHFPQVFSKIVLCNHWSTDGSRAIKKSQVCLDSGAQFLIDDLPRYVEDVASEGLSGLLFGDYPWNQQVSDHPQIHRVRHWQDVEQYFFPQSS